MKHDRKYTLFGWLPALALMLTTACAGIDDLDLAQAQQQGKQTVTFIIQQESQSGGTRADEQKPAPTGTIGRASKIDVLIYAVYESEDNGVTYNLTTNTDLIGGSKVTGFTVAKGQTAIAYKADSEKTTKITLLLEGDKTYQVAFWAQSTNTDAFDTSDLEKVEVKYTTTSGNPLNNDELRDAFCAVSDPITADGQTHHITLRRPLAQVNVGTTGWDYEGAAILRPSAVGYTKSKITLKGVARYYNVVKRKTLTKEDLSTTEGIADNGGSDTEDPSLTNVTFDYEKIPAFRNIDFDSDDWKNHDPKYTPIDDEEFLIVDLSQDNGIGGYVSWKDYKAWNEAEQNGKTADDYEEDDKYTGMNPDDTETFKYLSMCYVLVPEAGSLNIPNVETGAVLPEVSFTTYGEIIEEDNTDEPTGIDDEDGDENTEDETGATPKTVKKTFTIKNVPVQKNWRTNILGKGFFVGDVKCQIYVVPDYRGDYNNVGGIWQNGNVEKGENEEDDWHWKGEGSPNDNPNFPENDDYYPNKSDQGEDGE